MAIGNAINEQTTGICGFSGTAFTSSPATQHCVQIGGASTHLLASVTNGTTGQFLGANTGAAPTWQTPTTPFNPNSVITIVEDFIGQNNNTGAGAFRYNYSWATTNQAFINVNTTDSSHPGIMANQAIAAGNAGLLLGDFTFATKCFVLGGGAITFNWVFNVATLSTGTNTYTLRIGMGDTQAADEVNGVYVEYTNGVNSGNWQFKTANASSRTTSNSSVAVTTGWHNLTITINAAATSISYLMDGVSLGTAIATNIPTAVISPFIDIVRSAGTIAANSFFVDLFYLTQTLTTPR